MSNDEIKVRITAEADQGIENLRKFAEEESKVADQTKRAGDQAEEAGRKTRTREQRLSDMKRELADLHRVEQRYERQVQETGQADDKATRAHDARTRRIERLSNALAIHKKNQDSVNESVNQAAQSQSKFAIASGEVISSITALAAGFTGGLGINSLFDEYNKKIEANNRLLEENARIVRENAESRLDLAALKGVETPEDVAFIDKAAAFAGRRPGEIARVQTQFQSALPTDTEENIRRLVVELASAGQTSSAPLGELAPAFMSIYRLTGDARVSGNILQGAIEAAGEADPARLAQEIQKFVGIGKQIGGLDDATSVGFAAAGTGLNLPNEIATTGLKNVIFALRGRGTPEGVKVLEREGVPRDNVVAGLVEIQQAYASGRISSAELEAIGGREAAPVFAELSNAQTLKRFIDSVQIVKQAAKSEGRLSQEKIESIVGSSDAQRLNLLSKQQESATEAIKGADVIAAESDAAIQIVERVVAERIASGEITPYRGEAIRETFKRMIGRGYDPIFAAKYAGGVTSTSHIFQSAIQQPDTELAQEVYMGLNTGPVTSVEDAFDGSSYSESVPMRELQTPVFRRFGSGTVINNNIYGTVVNHGKNPLTSDLREGRPRR